MKQVMFIVGDQYREFASNSHVITESEFRQRASCDGSLGDACLVLGQGIGAGEELLEFCAQHDPSNTFIGQLPPLASRNATHKVDDRHILVTEPRLIQPGVYQAELVVNDVMDRLVDHVTGSHVSGMILIEAARQVSIAAIEVEELNDSGPHSFVWHGMNVSFSRFAFPLPTTLRVIFPTEKSSGRGNRFVDVEVSQAQEVVCHTRMEYGTMPTKVMHALEAKAARRAVGVAQTRWAEQGAEPSTLKAAEG